ncbi:hypothetical protein [Algoriphagus algorifonticola]|uniref:hypothetical protein n=1 Tax=Algoriphagus algorifonticola TaxID=2593007 RepID=UPI00119F13CC|nr:hypothetical protein [Algoriphagus algorifonticola]
MRFQIYLRLVILAFFLGLIHFSALSQSITYEDLKSFNSNLEGNQEFIILNTLEKKVGKIVRNFDSNKYEEIVFENSDGLRSSFDANQIKGFQLSNGRVFESVLIPGSSKRQFLQRLFSGQLMSLYSLGDRYYVFNGLEIYELRSVYDETKDISIKNSSRYVPYLSLFSALMAGDCFGQVAPILQKTKLTENDLIILLEKFHKCENAEYIIHVAKIPIFKVASQVKFGINRSGLRSNQKEEGRKDRLTFSSGYQASYSLQFEDFRNLPRFNFQISFQAERSVQELGSDLDHPIGFFKGQEEFQLETLSIPLSFNYEVYKKPNQLVYMGMGIGFAFSKLTSEFGMIEVDWTNQDYLSIFEKGFLKVQENTVFPFTQIGFKKKISQKLLILTELQLRYLPNYYYSTINQFESTYHRLDTSLNIGIQF